MTALGRRALFWTPRLLSILYIAFLSMFALDVFGEEHGFWRILLALAIHLIPSLLLLAVLILAWRWEWIGATLFSAAGLLYVLSLVPRQLPLSLKLTWILAIAVPAFVVAGLFLANWFRHDQLHAKY